jgi:hypothetical protein
MSSTESRNSCRARSVAAVLVLIALALAQVSFSYDGWVTGPAGRLRLLALLLLPLGVGFVCVRVKRRVWFADLAGGPRPTNLRSVPELHWQGWVPLVVATFGFALMVLFAYRAVEVTPHFGTATLAMLAVTGQIPGRQLPGLPRQSGKPASGKPGSDLGGALDLPGRQPLRPPLRRHALLPPPGAAAASVGAPARYRGVSHRVGELQDRSAAAGLDFARHVFTISGVSGFARGGDLRGPGCEPKRRT